MALSPAVQSGNMSHAAQECKELVQQLCVHLMMHVRAVLGIQRLTTWKRLLYRAATKGSSWPALSSDTHMCGQTASRWNAVTMRDLCHILLVQQNTQKQTDRLVSRQARVGKKDRQARGYDSQAMLLVTIHHGSRHQAPGKTAT